LACKRNAKKIIKKMPPLFHFYFERTSTDINRLFHLPNSIDVQYNEFDPINIQDLLPQLAEKLIIKELLEGSSPYSEENPDQFYVNLCVGFELSEPQEYVFDHPFDVATDKRFKIINVLPSSINRKAQNVNWAYTVYLNSPRLDINTRPRSLTTYRSTQTESINLTILMLIYCLNYKCNSLLYL
jgi:hypothetical protein